MVWNVHSFHARQLSRSLEGGKLQRFLHHEIGKTSRKTITIKKGGMMRKLSEEQKKQLRMFYGATGVVNVDMPKYLSTEEKDCIQKIYRVNPHETFYQNAVRFLMDIELEEVYNKPW